jgi:adenylosuccinate synthase
MAARAPLTADVVVGLGFGDEGKGTVVDHLVRRHRSAGVVRFGGGPQATHHVVLPDGRWHGFSQLGAGSFVAGVATHLTRDVLVEPVNLLAEDARLRTVGVADAMARLTIDPRAALVLPYHKMIGQLAELARGGDRHGSVGLGVGEAARDRDLGRAIGLGDARDPARLRARLADAIDERVAAAEALAAAGGDEARDRLAYFRRELDPDRLTRILHGFVTGFAAVLQPDELRVPALLGAGRPAVLEGAQGALLDPAAGFPPYVTKTPATPALADALVAGRAHRLRRVGVLRAYAHRHGPGPLPSEDPAMTAQLPEAHNAWNRWQGGFRVGPLDLVLARYAVAVAGADALALTCLDRLGGAGDVRIVTSYRHPGPAAAWWDDAFDWRALPGGDVAIDALRVGAGAPRADVTVVLDDCRPAGELRVAGWTGGLAGAATLADLPPGARDLVELVGSALGVPVAIVSLGPTWRDKLEI